MIGMTPDLQNYYEMITLLMSKMITDKQILSKKLMEANDVLIEKVYELRRKCQDLIELRSAPTNLSARIEEMETIICRIDAFTSSAARIMERKVGSVLSAK